MADKIIVEVVKKGNIYKALDRNGKDFTSQILTSTFLISAYENGDAIEGITNKYGDIFWSRVPYEKFKPKTKSSTKPSLNSNKDGVLVVETEISHREDGMLYFLGEDGHLWEEKNRGDRVSRKIIEKIGVVRENGYLYYPDEELNIRKIPIAKQSSSNGFMSSLAWSILSGFIVAIIIDLIAYAFVGDSLDYFLQTSFVGNSGNFFLILWLVGSIGAFIEINKN